MKAILLTLLLALLVPFAPEGETGSIYGVITEMATGDPIAYANVVIVGTMMGGMTLTDGTYRIVGVPPGTYTLKAMMMGYKAEVTHGVEVQEGIGVEINFEMEQAIVGKTQEIVVEGDLPQIKVGESDVSHRASGKHVRGGRSGDNLLSSIIRRPEKCRPRVPCIPPGHYHNTEEYVTIVENDFLDAIGNPLSTFSIDVDAASYGNTRRFIMNDRLPPRDAVRIEEFINYFDYDYERPDGDVPFSIDIEYASCPWNREHGLVHIGLRGEELPEEDQRPSNLVFLIDVSGSMRPENKLPLLRKAFLLLVDQLKNDDRVSIVVYAGAAGLVLPSTPGYRKSKIRDAIDHLRAGGSTAGHAGIQLAYRIAKENFIRGGNNRVILATDGDFNVGVSSTSELIRLIEEKREEGIFLTVLGFGVGNYKDHRLEQLADKGNGNHAYIDNILEAKKVLVDDVTATLYTIAKDVKIQVEFNPAKVSSYRLIGYENRLLKKEDFADDKKDAGEIGAGHTVTALYEIVPAGEKANTPEIEELKYLETKVKSVAWNTDEILTVRIRYKEPDGDTSKLISTVLSDGPIALDRSSENFRFAAAVAMYAMILRDSQYKGDASLKQVSALAKSALGDDLYTYRAEFLRIVERTKILAGLAIR